MGKEEGNSVLQWCSLVAMIVLVIGSFTWFLGSTIVVDEDAIADKVASQIDMDMTIPTVTAEVNLTGIEDRLDEIETTMNEDDDWENEAIAMAKYEWKSGNYRDLFKWMEDHYSIVNREDIDRVVVKHTDVFEVDVDDEDAEVVQELKVYYERQNGAERTAYITVDTTIEDGYVEDQDFNKGW